MKRMNGTLKRSCLAAALITAALSCSKGPKVIEPTNDKATIKENTGIFSQNEPPVNPHERPSPMATDIHTVVVQEVLPTVRYVYLRVKEGQAEFWIAALKQDIKVGGTYFFQGGLQKNNFESKEHKRVFDRMYLVSSIIEAGHSHNNELSETSSSQPGSNSQHDEVKGSIRIAELVARPADFEGKDVQVTGQVVKVNSNIMGRNWVHLRDGSKDDFDLVITCDVAITPNHQVTMKGKVVLERDFGAGYVYSILLEDGTLVR